VNQGRFTSSRMEYLKSDDVSVMELSPRAA
jgi:hypothetical protein